ncbi:MAG: alanine:cation symporter family protein [Bacteroidaceae bacterium]|nr:alanine:cation symporter family protein [Bacteroidaceae bacterium]
MLIEIINQINNALWTWLVIPLLIGCALWFTFKLGGLQFRYFPLMVRQLLESNNSVDKSDGKKHVSSFHAFVVSLASRIGTGNLAGVASAIFVGGPGAVFWMWVMALFGAATAFVEATLAQLYKRRGKDAFYGGPAYYMLHGLHSRWLGVLFSICMTITFGMANQIMQSNQISTSLSDTIGLPPLSFAIALSLLTGMIIIGGIHRIAKFSAVVVPFMAVAYLLLALYVIGSNIAAVPEMLRVIVSDAFGLEQAAGGAIGITVMQGVKRGLFSNEAGEGSAPNAAAVAETSHPVKQGLVQALGVFTDTLLVCTCTAMIILLSGVYKTGDADGILLTTRSLETEIGSAARYFISVAIFFFAYSSIIGNYYYGETAMRYVSQKKSVVRVYQAFTVVMVILGGVLVLDEIWSLIDLCMCSIVILNVYSILRLSPKVVFLWKNYRQQLSECRNPEFHKEMMPHHMDDLEAW